MKQIFLGSDHAGATFKNNLRNYFKEKIFFVEDCGASQAEQSVDYPDFAHIVCRKVLSHKESIGILICGSGVGMSIVANRYPGIRAALCWNPEVARLSREHDDANVLVLGARLISYECAQLCVEAFLNTSFEGGRHQRRIDKIDTIIN